MTRYSAHDQRGPRRGRAALWPLAALAMVGCATMPLAPPAPPPAQAEPRPEPAPPTQEEDAPLVVKPAPAMVDDEGRLAKLKAASAAIDAHLEAQLKAQKMPGFVVGVVAGGKLAYTRALGVRDTTTREPADAQTIYRIGSITKTFTAAAILALRDEGKLSLDVPASRYLPEFAKVTYPSSDSPPITLRHLLTHSSGLPRLGAFDYTRPDAEVTEREMLEALASTTLDYAPGTDDVYSNFGFSLAGLIAGRVSGKGYRALVTESIFVRLGMGSAAFDEKDLPPGRLATGYGKDGDGIKPVPRWRLGASEAAGGIYASLEDMSRFVAFQLAAYPPRDGDDSGPLRRASVRESHVAARPGGLTTSEGSGPDTIEATASGQALGWATYETCDEDLVVMHSGAVDGYTASVHFFPQAGVGLIFMTNYIEADRKAVTHKLRATLREAGVLAPRRPDAQTLTRAVGAAVALYNAHDDRRYEDLFAGSFKKAVPAAALRSVNEKLRARHGDCELGPALDLGSPSRGRFEIRCRTGKMEATATLNERGALRGLTLRSYLPPSREVTDLASRLLDARARARRELFAGDEARQAAEKQLASLPPSCKLGEPRETDGDEQSFFVSCEHSARRKLTLTFAPLWAGKGAKAPAARAAGKLAVARVSIETAPAGKCAVR